MLNKDDDEDEDTYFNSRIGPGELLAFGNLNLILTLNLEKDDLTKYKVEWNDIKSLKDLKFIRKHHHFWKRVELSSNNETFKILLNINKTSPKLIHIGYVVFKRLRFNDEQSDFKKVLYGVLKKKGLFITSCDMCSCSVSVQLLLKYEKEEKTFSLVKESKVSKNPENEEKEKEKEKENEKEKSDDDNNNDNEKEEGEKSSNKSKHMEEGEHNPFINFQENGINYGDFDYIYFGFNDYMTGEFKGKIKLENLFEFFQDIKIRTRTKIIVNFESDIEIFRNKNREEIFKDLLSITDFFIFYNVNKLYEVLKELKEEEDKEIIDESYRIQCFKAQKRIIDKKKIERKRRNMGKKL